MFSFKEKKYMYLYTYYYDILVLVFKSLAFLVFVFVNMKPVKRIGKRKILRGAPLSTSRIIMSCSIGSRLMNCK